MERIRAAASFRRRAVPAGEVVSSGDRPSARAVPVGGTVSDLARWARASGGLSAADTPGSGLEEVFRRRLSRAGRTPGCVWDGRSLVVEGGGS